VSHAAVGQGDRRRAAGGLWPAAVGRRERRPPRTEGGSSIATNRRWSRRPPRAEVWFVAVGHGRRSV